MMNVVNSGSRYQIYGEEVKTYNHLPTASYEVAFSKMTGFFLVKRPDLAVNEEKIYGNHEARVEKVMRSFDLSTRNFGIILSGQKGIGKTLMARMLAKKSVEKGLPVITVNEYIPGIADFLGSIEQEVVVIFDEFEKTFSGKDGADPQTELLPLFDGLDSGKKLFVITCNEVSKLNSYLLNRPGRFHYHFTVKNPSDEEVRQYMSDKLDEKYHGVIEQVVNFARTVYVTYDYLRAIAFEINQGYSLEEALGDLNISSNSDVAFNIEVVLTNGERYMCYGRHINLYSKETNSFRAYDTRSTRSVIVNYRPSEIVVNDGKLYISGDKVNLELDEYDFPGLTEEQVEELARTSYRVDHLNFTKCDYSTGNKIVPRF